MNKPVYLGMSILDFSKTLIYEFWYDYIKQKYQDRTKLCYVDTDSFLIHIKTKDFYKDIANDVEKWFDTSNYDENNKRLLPIGNNKKGSRFFKDKLGGKIVTEFTGLRAKTWAYLIDVDDDSEKKNVKGTKKCVIERWLMFNDYKDCLLRDKTILKLQQRFKSDHHDVHTEEINKIAQSSDDNKRLITNIW